MKVSIDLLLSFVTVTTLRWLKQRALGFGLARFLLRQTLQSSENSLEKSTLARISHCLSSSIPLLQITLLTSQKTCDRAEFLIFDYSIRRITIFPFFSVTFAEQSKYTTRLLVENFI